MPKYRVKTGKQPEASYNSSEEERDSTSSSSSPSAGSHEFEIDELKKNIAGLHQYRSVHQKNISPEIKERLLKVVNDLEKIPGTDHREEVVQYIKELYKNDNVQPETVGALFYGCLANQGNHQGKVGCSALCSGNFLESTANQCDHHVYSFEDSSLKAKHTSSNNSGHVIINRINNKVELNNQHINYLKSRGYKKVTLKNFNDGDTTTIWKEKDIEDCYCPKPQHRENKKESSSSWGSAIMFIVFIIFIIIIIAIIGCYCRGYSYNSSSNECNQSVVCVETECAGPGLFFQ